MGAMKGMGHAYVEELLRSVFVRGTPTPTSTT
jgi:hypothetical protein